MQPEKPAYTAIALDLGTTAIKAGLLDGAGDLEHVASYPAPEIAVNGARYESDALAYAGVAERALEACRAMASGAPLGLCSQRSSLLVWNRASGDPVTPLISWQDARGAASCAALGHAEERIRALTGLRLTPYYFAPKLRVVLAERPELREGLARGELLAGTLDTFLTWRWTGGKRLVTDASMAARTLLMDIGEQRWSSALCDLFGIPVHILPAITPSAGLNIPLDNGLILQASMGDQSAALIASVGAGTDNVLVNLGTGGFALRCLGEGEAALAGYLRTLVYQDSAHRAHIAMEGTLNSLAAALAPYPVAECGVDELARNDIFCLSEPSGLGAPYFRGDLGIRYSAPIEQLSPKEVGCLLLEGIVFRVARMLEDFHHAAPVGRVFLSGGLSQLAALRQGIAVCAPCDVYLSPQKDSSLLGAGLLAAGLSATPYPASEIVHADHPALPAKYLRWKRWFDSVLEKN